MRAYVYSLTELTQEDWAVSNENLLSVIRPISVRAVLLQFYICLKQIRDLIIAFLIKHKVRQITYFKEINLQI